MHCCGVDGSKDFLKAEEFNKYAKVYAEENNLSLQKLPETCCKLKPRNQTDKEDGLFVPEDANCLTAPTTWNSNMDEVSGKHNVMHLKTYAHLFC